MSGLAALGVLVAGVIAGVILYTAGHWVIGIIVMMAAIPVALVTWVRMNERM
jgi:hypothetical protein